jgi:hypothetical protein
MSSRRNHQPKKSNELPEQLREMYAELGTRDYRHRLEVSLLRHASKLGPMSAGLRQCLADWPTDFERRIAAGETLQGGDANVSLVTAYPKALEIFFGAVDEQGLAATLRELLVRRFSDDYLFDDQVTRWDVFPNPSITDTLFGAGRALVPWLEELYRDGDFTAACWLCEIAPGTPGLAESILGRLTDCDDLWERLFNETAYPMNYRKYYPFSTARIAEYALRFVRPAGAVPLNSLPTGGRSLFYHSIRSLFREAPTDGRWFAASVALLSSSDRTTRRRAMLAIYYYPDLYQTDFAATIRQFESSDPYVVEGCRLAQRYPGLLSQLATPTELCF